MITLQTHRAWDNPIDLCHHPRKVNMRLNLDERITNSVNLYAMMFVSERAVLMTLRVLIKIRKPAVQDKVILPKII